MKYYLIAGEASGDLHASNLMAALKENDPKAEFLRLLALAVMLARERDKALGKAAETDGERRVL